MSDISRVVLNTGSGATDEQESRRSAVAAAAELIGLFVQSGSGNASLSYEMSQLSHYADLIQAAVKNK